MAEGSGAATVTTTTTTTTLAHERLDGVEYRSYEDERVLPAIMELVGRDLSEPYSVYTYRYFIHGWPQLCHLALVDSEVVGVIVCRQQLHVKSGRMRGYIAMVAVQREHRKRNIGLHLVFRAVTAMKLNGAEEVALEAEVSNTAALRLYEKLGFVRHKRLYRYYLNGGDAFRLKLWLRAQ